jgi:hypothetical protein
MMEFARVLYRGFATRAAFNPGALVDAATAWEHASVANPLARTAAGSRRLSSAASLPPRLARRWRLFEEHRQRRASEAAARANAGKIIVKLPSGEGREVVVGTTPLEIAKGVWGLAVDLLRRARLCADKGATSVVHLFHPPTTSHLSVARQGVRRSKSKRGAS